MNDPGTTLPRPDLALDSRTVLVTGAARGIGWAVAERAAGLGARVVLCDLDQTVLERAETLARAGAQALGVRADVAVDEECRGLVDAARERFGDVHVLVNNAAVGAFDMTTESTSEAEWDRVLSVNLKSAYLMARHAIPAIRAAGGGAIVNVSSIHALATSRGVIPYAAAKGGLLAMTRAMAIDLAPDRIRVVAVLPGATDTPMLQQHVDREGTTIEELGFSREAAVLGRVASPAEVADTILFAASPLAATVTGSAIVADSGLLAAAF